MSAIRHNPKPSGMRDPGEDAAAVTPDDDVLIPTTRGLYVGGAGDISVVMKVGTSATFEAVPAGSLLPLRVIKVMETGTTATAIVAVY